ncbi:MAG: lytic transglycosylase domain-containing protein [Bacteriovoracaceae bacterium]|nr:lytic transglycosylase domain-containing protein [Bacteriovoracaceae bacterium]
MRFLTIILCFAVSLNTLAARKRELASIKEDERMVHAKELMGKGYKKSVLRNAEHVEFLEQSILKTVESRLPKKYKNRAHDVTEAIIVEANKHGLDPFFVMAVISGESSFNPEAKGPVGEIGLMQLRSSTGKWIAKLSKIKWGGEKDLKDPVKNIRLGAAYLSWLREKFEGHGQLYLAAYNMGPKNVKSALAKNVRPKDYPIHVMKRYLAFYKSLENHKI